MSSHQSGHFVWSAMSSGCARLSRALLLLLLPLIIMSKPSSGAEPVLEIGEQKDRAKSMAYSPDGKILAVSDESFDLKLFDAASGKLLRKLPGNDTNNNRVCWSPDGRTIHGIGSNEWMLWDATTGATKRKIPCDMTGTSAKCMALSPDGKVFATAGQGVLKLWDAESGTARGEFAPHGTIMVAIAFSPDSKSIATCGWDRKVQISTVATGALGRAFEFERNVLFAEFSRDGKTVFVVDENATLHQFDVASGNDTPAPRLRFDPTQIAVSPDGKLVAVAGGARVQIWSRPDNTWRTVKITDTATEVTAVAFSPDGKRIATGGTNRGILVWNVSDIPAEK
jgi:WD40 repeat protein